MKQKVEIMSMTDEILSPITKASNVLLEDGSNVQQLIDNYVEPEFTPTIETSSSMSKVGQGDNVDFSENVIGSAYNSCVLKGKTLVNYNAEGNDRNEYVCMPSVEGESVTVNGTVEGMVKSAILKGQTLVNLLSTCINKPLTNTTHSGYIQFLKPLESGKEYTIIISLSNAVTTTDAKCLNIRGNKVDGSFTPIYDAVFKITNGIQKVKFTPTDGFVTCLVAIGSNAPEGSSVTMDYFMIIEGDHTNEDIPYFTGMSSVKMPVLTITTSQNLSSIPFSFFEKTTDRKYGAWTIFEFDNLFSGKIIINKRPFNTIMYFDTKENRLNIGTTVVKDVQFIGFYNPSTNIENNNSGNLLELLKSGELDLSLQENRKPNIYSYKTDDKTNILSCNEEVTLRGIGDVKDTLDLTTGELTQRIGEVVLDGVEKKVIGNVDNGFRISVNGCKGDTKGINVKSDKIPCGSWSSGRPLSNTYYLYARDVGDEVVLKLPTSDASNINEANVYLQQNPIIMQYKLKEPAIKTVDLSDNHVYSYNDTTHYDCSSVEGSLVPTLSIEEGVKYQAIIKPSTKYSIVFNRTVASDSLTVDLGGATANVVSTAVGKTIVQITTLPTLSHNYVKFLGVGNAIKDVQVIEGEVADDVEYFEDMIDVENPVVTNCNILDVDSVGYKSNTISTNEVVLRSLPNGVCDTLDLMTGEYVQRVGVRAYQEGDESNSQVSTDKVNTQYQLETPITTTIDLKQHPYAYKDGYINLSSNGENSLTPTIEYSLPINRSGQVTINTQLVQKQQKQLDELESMIIANMVNTQYKQTLSSVEYMLGGE